MAQSSPPRVDFYLLSSHVPDGKLKFTCRLTKKIHGLGKRVSILVDSENTARKLDDLLWTFDQSSFVPHARQDAAGAAKGTAPVCITHESPSPSDPDEVLLSLLQGVADCAQRYKRVAELVDNDPAEKRAARERFRYYRDSGFKIETHEVSV